MPIRKNPTKLRLSLVLVLSLLSAPAHAVESLTIMADSSMSLAISAIARSYAKESQVVVNTSFAPDKAQETLITEGAAADILITPRSAWIDTLKMQGLVDISSKTVVAKGRLALVGPADTDIKLAGPNDFPTTALVQHMAFEPGFVVGFPENLVEGVASQEALRNYEAFGDLEPYLLYAKQQEEMYDLVERQGAYGLFLDSTVIGRNGMKILSVIPERMHKPIEYYAVVIAGDNMGQARKFLDFLKSRKAAVLLAQYGFAS